MPDRECLEPAGRCLTLHITIYVCNTSKLSLAVGLCGRHAMLIFAIVNKRLHLIACSVIVCGILLLARQPFKAARLLSCKVWVRHPCWFSQSWISVRLCRIVPVINTASCISLKFNIIIDSRMHARGYHYRWISKGVPSNEWELWATICKRAHRPTANDRDLWCRVMHASTLRVGAW